MNNRANLIKIVLLGDGKNNNKNFIIIHYQVELEKHQ